MYDGAILSVVSKHHRTLRPPHLACGAVGISSTSQQACGAVIRDSVSTLSCCPQPSLSGPRRSDQRGNCQISLPPVVAELVQLVWVRGAGRCREGVGGGPDALMCFAFVHNGVHLFSGPPSIRITSILDDSAPLSRLPSWSEGGGVEVGLVGGKLS